MENTQKTLVKKLSEVMKQVKYIEKKGFNKFHGYKYATESDVAEKVREVLADNNVMMIPNLLQHSMREHINAKGKTEYIVAVDMEFKFYDGDSGEELTFHMSGEGQDAGDKGIYKAITGAQKYALMKVFMIPTGDDPEADNGVDERNESYRQPEITVGEKILLSKWLLLGGTEDQFAPWYEGQKLKYNNNQIDVYLTKKLQANKKGA
jgi:hypothetical protein